MSEQSQDEPVGQAEPRGMFTLGGRLPIPVVVAVAALLVGAVGAGGWYLGDVNQTSANGASPGSLAVSGTSMPAPASTSTSSSTSAPMSTSTTSAPTSTSTSITAFTSDDTMPTTTTDPNALTCGPVPPLPGSAQDVSTAPVDFDGDGAPDVLRVYRLGADWHARAEIGGTVRDDDVLAGPGPSMAAIGGATVDGDAFEEAWIKVGSGPPADAVGLFVFQGCDLKRVVSDENGAPYIFPIELSSTETFGLRCLGSNGGLENFETTSTDGGATYTGHGQEYGLLAFTTPPTMEPGATNGYAESSSNPGFPQLHQFTCDGLGPALP